MAFSNYIIIKNVIKRIQLKDILFRLEKVVEVYFSLVVFAVLKVFDN